MCKRLGLTSYNDFNERTVFQSSYFYCHDNLSRKKDISCRIPYEAYNDGGKYESSASITIPKGETKGTYEMDYNGSPLVFYHGDIKGYKLYEGTISGDGIYNYSFYRYW